LSMPLLINDGPTARGFVAAGMLPEDAWEYTVIGCNELGVPGRSAESATSSSGLIQHLELLNQTLLQHPDPDAIGDMSSLLRALEETMRRHAFAARERAAANRQRRIARVPTPFTSALMRGCIARGRDMQEGMAYHLPGLYERGLANAANALAAIEQAVFERMRSERERIAAQLRAEGEEESKQIRSSADKDVEILLAEARKDAEKVRGEGDARALEIYAEAYNQDPEFYRFWRTLESYKNTLADNTRIILDTEADYLMRSVYGPSHGIRRPLVPILRTHDYLAPPDTSNHDDVAV